MCKTQMINKYKLKKNIDFLALEITPRLDQCIQQKNKNLC